MDNSNIATAEQRRDEGPLAGLAVRIKEAAAFADSMPTEYRARAFDLAFEQLGAGAGATAVAVPPPAGGSVILALTPTATGALAVLARELGVERDALSRVVAISDDGKVTLIPRVEARGNAEMQIEYSLMYAFIKERAFNQIDVPSEELRELCRSKSCYNKDHYADYFASAADLVNAVGKGKARAYRLTKKGVEVAKELLKKLVES